jgi:hypothetical protein
MTFRPMIHRPIINRAAYLLLEIAGVAVGGVLVIVAIAIWRLSVAPVEAGFIHPYLEQAINDAHLGFSVQLTETRIEWHRFRPVLGLHFRGVSVLGPGGQAVGALQDGTLGLSVRDLAFGRLSVIEIDLYKPEITIVRDKTDHFSLKVGQADSSGGDSADFGSLLEQFIEQPNDQSQTGRLLRVHLVDGKVLINDQKLGLTWSAPDVDINLGRTASQATAKIDMVLALPKRTARLAGQARYIRAEGRIHLALNIAGFDAAAAAPLAQFLSPLSALAVPVSGQVHAVIDKGGEVLSGDAALHGEQGNLVLPAFYPLPLAIRTTDIKLHFTSAPQHLVLDQMAVDFGDAKLSINGTADFNDAGVAIDAHTAVADIPLARFDALWPRGMAAGGRDWVTAHIPDGVLKSGAVHVVASGQPGDPNSIQATKVDGSFDYTGMEVHYFPSLPPLRAIAGHATFDASRMDLSIDSGLLNDIAVSKGALAITGLDQDEQAIDVGLTAQGPVKTLLAILDMKPLGYAHDLGLAPDGVAGRLNLRANFAFPAIKSLLFSQIALSAKGTLDGIAAPGVVGPRDISEGALNIALDKAGMTLDGTARLSGVPLGFDWHESFVATDKIRSRINFHTEPDDADRAALMLAAPDPVALKGKIAVKGAVTIDRAHTTTLDATADIGQADIAIDKFGIHKQAGEAGTTDLSLVFDGDTIRHIPRVKIAANNLNLIGLADFGADGSLQHAVLSRFTNTRNDFALTLDTRPGDTKPGAAQTYVLSLKGAQFDAAPILSAKSSGAPPTHTPHLELTVGLDRLMTGAETRLEQVAGTATLSGGRLDRADVKAMAGGPLTLSYVPAGDVIALHLAADDAGAALWGMGLTRGVKGGTLHIDGTTDPGRNPWMTTGTLDIRNFRLTDAPIAARLVNAVSPTGFVDLVYGKGLGFDRLSAEIDYAGGKITLGISFEGDVDLDRDKVALKGTIVPVDTFNKIVAAIPLIGDVLTGGSRGGFLGATYSVAGSANDPHVSVNPLSMFAPGFLRNLFFLGPSQAEPKGDAAPSPAEVPPATAADPAPQP